MKRFLVVLVFLTLLFSCKKEKTTDDTTTVTIDVLNQNEIRLIGHASFKIKDKKGTVVYVDPFYGSEADYSEPADFIFVTHSHGDHNKIELVTKKNTTKIISAEKSVPEGTKNVEFILPYKSEVITDNISFETFPAINDNHKRENNFLGFIFTIDEKKFYIAGDTSFFEEMSELPAKNIDYAFLPIDGVYNMDAAEATNVAAVVEAKYVIPIHTGFDENGPAYSEKNVEAFTPASKIVLKYGDNFMF